MHALYACVLPPAPFCPYSHLPLTGSHRPPISMAHLDWMFLQPLSATAAPDAKIETAAAAAIAAAVSLHFITSPPDLNVRATSVTACCRFSRRNELRTL